MLNKYSHKIISFFFFFHLLDAIFKIFKIDFQFDKILDFSILVIIFSIKNYEIKIIDRLVIFYLAYSLFTILINDYPHQLIISYYVLKNTWVTILLFFIGQNTYFLNKIIYTKMLLPITFSLICGIIFYLTNPSWYYAIKSANLDVYANDISINEYFRMSSFWPSPQFIGYSNFIFFTFLLYRKYVLQNINNFIFVFLIIISFISAIFIQIRVSIAFIFISLFIFIFWDIKYNKGKNKIISLYIFFISLIIICIIFLLLNFSNNIYILEKINSIFNITTTTNQRINEQLDIVEIFNKYDINLFGYGFGRFSIAVSKFKMPDLRDGGFLHEILETGLIGFSILLLITFLTFIRLIKYFNLLVFEFLIFIFYIGASLGSNAISEFYLVNGIFWLNLGIIWNKNILNHNYKLHKH
jgi:hypothetical protein